MCNVYNSPKSEHSYTHNGAMGNVMRDVHVCTLLSKKCTCSTYRYAVQNFEPLCCIKLDTATPPCCGSGGFFLACQSFLADPEHYSLGREQKEFLKNETFYGNEIVAATFKTALMNLYLHNIGDIYGNIPITLGDALLTDPGYRVDYVMTNPPFGKKSSITGTFYKPGVKANVIFFDKRPASPDYQTKEVWVYDFRTNVHFTLKQHPMTDADLQDFIACYNPTNRYERKETWSKDNPEGRWRKFSLNNILQRDKTSLDIFWMKDKSLADLDNLPTPDELAADIIENLQSALESFQELKERLGEKIG